MIDLKREQPIPMNEACNHIPGRPSRATVWRWALRGVRKNLLDTVLIGARRYTTAEAIERFLAASNPAIANAKVCESRQQRAVTAIKKLASRGI